ncbi:GH1 family beta-glucosidase [Oscillospiraceae bacterium PP1C4]
MEKLHFPKGFIWGSATASYQVEGAVREDGRGESIWDRYCAVPGNVLNGDTGEVACDHYHRYKEDVQLMKKMGLHAYRFSVAWPRVMPNGRGEVNEKGIAFYSDLVDELLAAGIEPYVTLYHWDMPQALQDIGGWANEDMPGYFLEYCKVVFDRLGDRVKHWITLNEPYCAAFLGHFDGRQAPGLRDFSTAVRASYYMYVGHGLAVKHFRESGLDGEIGITLNLMGRLPYSDSDEDAEAANYADGYLNRWFLDPIIRGSYPQDMVDLYRSKGVVLPEFKAEDLALMSQPLDFMGLNYYNDFYVKRKQDAWPLGFIIQNPPYMPVTDRNWPITENGLKNMLLRMKNEYGIDRILITENGASYHDVVSLDHKVEDYARLDYFRRHIAAMHEAMQSGVNVVGYFLWSLCDNFEWGFGYSSRFGVVYINFETQERIIKESGRWFMSVIQQNAIQ